MLVLRELVDLLRRVPPAREPPPCARATRATLDQTRVSPAPARHRSDAADLARVDNKRILVVVGVPLGEGEAARVGRHAVPPLDRDCHLAALKARPRQSATREKLLDHTGAIASIRSLSDPVALPLAKPLVLYIARAPAAKASRRLHLDRNELARAEIMPPHA
eukprot:CAMPEP_0185546814 /NCGR_PEP_ID=MMETSP1381-20130426/5716_1 /TAXON_ID=298111 /ORGANISM="Pavlova sp., Strain CCMP459" /LENGTH=162 /DNA_ID=CAMNT_0028159297 /DNA_START=403 /DNA_END=888 /DNA_ORIENTATION=+